MWLGKFANIKKVAEDVYEEVSASMTEEQFLELYNFAVNSQEYGALVIDMSYKKSRFLRNWDNELILNK
jgi:hypothetical protein